MGKIILEYFKYCQEYTEKYGERTIVLIQIGSFYESYEYDPDKDVNTEVKPVWPDIKVGNAVILSHMLNMTLTKKNSKKIYSLDNPNMLGFPCIAYNKYRDIILSNDHTIVRIDQEKEGKNVKRFVAEILSPATVIDDLSLVPISNTIVSLYIEIQKIAPKLEDYLIICGISSIDVTTGDNMVAEIYSCQNNAIHALQEVYRFLTSINPREIIIDLVTLKSSDTEAKQRYKNYIHNILGLDNYAMIIFKVDEVNKIFLKPDYQVQFLTKLFCNIKGITKNPVILEELDLDKLHYATISYINLLQYCYEHNERLIEKISPPNTGWLDQDKHLVLAHNALDQLDVISNNYANKKRKDKSLFSVIDNTSTVLGRRYLSTMLTNPITIIDSSDNKLQRYYDMTEDLINNDHVRQDLESLLKEIPDLERYQRKLQLRIIMPNEFVTLFRAYTVIVKLYTCIYNSGTELKSLLFEGVKEFNSCLAKVLSRYNLEILCSAKLDSTNNILLSSNSIIYSGVDLTADKYQSEIDKLSKEITVIVDYLNGFLGKTRGKMLEYDLTTDTKGKVKDETKIALFTTAYKAKIIKQASDTDKINQSLTGKLQFTNVNKEVMITSDKIAGICNKLVSVKEEFSQYLYRSYMATVNDICNCSFFSQVTNFVKEIDFVKSNAKTAIKYNYFKPQLVIDQTYNSWLEVQDIRHPIVERIIDSEYITNSLTLGNRPVDPNKDIGLLLFAPNALGKSTLAKAVGLNLILAQAGCYTAGKLKFKPFKQIITRLSGNDSLLEGKSSFVVEMTELRTILRNADSSTLVIGDELCRGTESISGTALTIATLKTLVDRNSSFIFSTHMHHLVKSHYVQSIAKELRIAHLVLKYDQENDCLIYDRKIKDGSGDSIYGLEVAKSLSLDSDFISLALEIRKELIGDNFDILSTKRSKYNSNCYMDSCISCGKKVISGELETHHIAEQMLADDKGFIEHYHKNANFNLVTLCKDCHNKLHGNGLKIASKETSKGNLVTFPMISK